MRGCAAAINFATRSRLYADDRAHVTVDLVHQVAAGRVSGRNDVHRGRLEGRHADDSLEDRSRVAVAIVADVGLREVEVLGRAAVLPVARRTADSAAGPEDRLDVRGKRHRRRRIRPWSGAHGAAAGTGDAVHLLTRATGRLGRRTPDDRNRRECQGTDTEESYGASIEAHRSFRPRTMAKGSPFVFLNKNI